MTAAAASPPPVRRLTAVPPSVAPATVVVLTADGELFCSDPHRLPQLAERLAALVGARAGRPRPLREPAPRPREDTALRLGRLQLEPDGYAAVVAGRRVALTAREFELLLVLARAAGRTLTRRQLLDAVWPSSAAGEAGRTVDVHVARLRGKLGPAAGQLVTVRGVGYRLEPA
jgi:DNA-binding response OmpR family regulator